MTFENTWRFLVVDDKQADEVEQLLAGNRISGLENVIVEKCKSFSEAINILEALRIDLIILDVKDDSIDLEDEDTQFAGEIVFNQIRQLRFIPIVFHTAYASKVKSLENPFVRIVSRDEPRKLRIAIQEIFQTRLPQLTRHLEAEQKSYMWDHVQNHWKNFSSIYDNIDLTYLLGRRLAKILERNSIRQFLASQESSVTPESETPESETPESIASESVFPENDNKIHPVEMYIYPPNNSGCLAGDIFKEQSRYWLMLTPSCYIEHDKADKILFAECLLLSDQSEYKDAQKYWTMSKKARQENSGTQPKKTALKLLINLINDNRQGQSSRYKFLPGTYFLPDLLVDFQSLRQIEIKELGELEKLVSLDNPFAEECITKFTSYYSRIGTPDLDIEIVCKRLNSNEEKSSSESE